MIPGVPCELCQIQRTWADQAMSVIEDLQADNQRLLKLAAEQQQTLQKALAALQGYVDAASRK